MKETRICPVCGKSFEEWHSRSKRYCSTKCSNNGKNEHRIKNAEIAKEKLKGRIPWNKGVPCSEEAKQKLSIANKKVERNEIWKQRISIALKKNNYWKNSGHASGTMTKAEQKFSLDNPHLVFNKCFGTGKDGIEKYGKKWHKVDFYDEQNNVGYEIDGSIHLIDYYKARDERKIRFLVI